jgi:CDP-paratose 2-epimerase
MTRSRPEPKSRVLITGGAGFVATNLADRLLHDGYTVALFDNLSRPGVQQNVEWLRQTYGPRVQVILGDVRDRDAVSRAMRGIAQVYHFAAQVAVTTSLTDPFLDFDVNARGTLNVLEAARASQTPPSILFTSTNKVYGRLDDVELLARGTRYEPIDPDVRRNGFDEHRPLDFHSPYGCSKGAAEQYVLDYAHTFGLKAIVFRMSCIFGPHQFGTEDQGWIAHFLIAALRGLPLTVYGDGLQVRDALFVEDLVEAMIVAHRDVDVLSGQAFNMGGGPGQTTSLLELLQLIAELTRRTPSATLEGWRTADQRYFVSDTTKFRNATGWRPRVGVREGVTRLRDWLVGVAHDNPAGDLVTS